MSSRVAQLGKQFINMASKTKTDITLYTVGTPNGIKASILLEELGLDYKVSRCSATISLISKLTFMILLTGSPHQDDGK